MNIPEELLYTKEHEWVKLVDESTLIVGVTDFAQSSLGDIVYVEVDTVGDTIESEEVFGTIEAVKTVSDLFQPITGEIIEFNENLDNNPELVNSDPYGEGWIIKVNVENGFSKENLLTAEEYKKII
jgi:glycine cleavage system H protein